MKAPPRYCITIEGEGHRVLVQENATGAVGYLMARLVTGQDVADDAWRSYGLRVTVEPDTDQGPD